MINQLNIRQVVPNTKGWSFLAISCLMLNLCFAQVHQIEIPFEYSAKNTQSFRSDFYDKPAGSGSYQLEIRLSQLKQLLQKSDDLVFQFAAPQELEIQVKLLQSLGSSMAFIDEKNISVEVGYGFKLTRINRGILSAHVPKNPLSIGIFPIGLTSTNCQAVMKIDFQVSFENNPASGMHSFKLSIPYKIAEIGSLTGLSGTDKEFLYWQETQKSRCSRKLYAKTYGKEAKYLILEKWNKEYRNKLDGLFSSNAPLQTTIEELKVLFSQIPNEAELVKTKENIQDYISDFSLWEEKQESISNDCEIVCLEKKIFKTNAATKALKAICQNCTKTSSPLTEGISRGLSIPASPNLSKSPSSLEVKTPNTDTWKAKWALSKAEGIPGIEAFLAMHTGSIIDSAKLYVDSALYMLPMQIRADSTNQIYDSIMLIDIFFPYQQIEVFPSDALQIQTQRISSNIIYDQDTALIQWNEESSIHLLSLLIEVSDDSLEQIHFRDNSLASQWQAIPFNFSHATPKLEEKSIAWHIEDTRFSPERNTLEIDIASNFGREEFKPTIFIAGNELEIDSIRNNDSLSLIYASLPDITMRGQSESVTVKLNKEERTTSLTLGNREHPFKNGFTQSSWMKFSLSAIGSYFLILLILWLLLSQLIPYLSFISFRKKMILKKKDTLNIRKPTFRNLQIKDNELLVNCTDYLVPYSYWRGSSDHPCRTEVCPLPVCRCSSTGANSQNKSFLSMHPVHISGNWLFFGIIGSFFSFLLFTAIQYVSPLSPELEVRLLHTLSLRLALSLGIFSTIGISIKRQYFHMYSWRQIIQTILSAIIFSSLISTAISSIDIFLTESILWDVLSWTSWAFTGSLILVNLVKRSWLALILHSLICGTGISFIYQISYEIENFPWLLLLLSIFTGISTSLAFLFALNKNKLDRIDINEGNKRYSSLLPLILLQKKRDGKFSIGTKDSSSGIQLGMKQDLNSTSFALHKETQSGYWIELIQGSLLIKNFYPSPGQEIKLISNTENQAYILTDKDKISLPNNIELQYFSG